MRSRPADLALLAGTLFAAWAFDLAVHAPVIGFGFTFCIGVAVALVVLLGQPTNLWARVALAGSLVMAPWLTLRSSPWLQWPDLMAALALLVLGAVFAYSGNPFNVSAAMVRGRSQLLVTSAVSTPRFLGDPVARMGPANAIGLSLRKVGRGLAIAVPVATIVGILLASADPVFASFFNLQVDPVGLTGHLLLLTIGAWVAGTLLQTSLAAPADQPFTWRLRLEPIEAVVVLLTLDATFAVFAIAQLVAALGGGQEAMRAANMTYADYARSGFFQLLAVAAITLPVVVAVTMVTRRQTSRAGLTVVAFAEVAAVLTIAIVVVAHQRLSLYEAAYGFTMLRLYSHVFALWIAIVFGLFGVSLLVTRWNHHWFAGAAVLAGLVIMLALNVINPEALVVRLDVDQSRLGQTLDSVYLTSLSNDATPSLFDALHRVPQSEQSKLRKLLCAGTLSSDQGWASYNAGRDAAAQARRSC